MQPKPRIEFSLSMLVLVIVIGLSLVGGERQAEAGESEVLAGLFGVEVVVEGMAPDAERYGLTKTTLQTDIEIRLRHSGIRVLTNTQRLRAPGNPYLYLQATTIYDEGLFFYDLELSLRERIRLDRNPAVTEYATTWLATAIYGTIGARRLHRVRRSVGNMVDQFINDYLAANPRQ